MELEHRRDGQDGSWAPAVWVVGRATAASELLVGAFRERGVRAELVSPVRLCERVRAGDVALGRLDVRPTLDGVEDGVWELRRAARAGTLLLNPASSLVACHDKLQTALRLDRVGVPHPATSHVAWDAPPPDVEYPIVLKPRFGSWGRDVWVCDSRRELGRCLRHLRGRAWFRSQGVLVQALIPPAGFDLRVVVAGGQVVGAIERVSAPGEWRTNIALGGRRRRAEPSPEACVLATHAAAAVGGDLVGVDLIPLADGGHVVLEVNGAVEFTREYSLAGRDVFGAAASILARDVTETGVSATASGQRSH